MLTRTGRNESCPCDSGKKYKRCCLGKPPFSTDGQTIRILDSFKKNISEIKKAHISTRSRLNEMIAEVFRDAGADIETDALHLREYVQWLENETAGMISRQNPTFWLSVDRRVPAWVFVQKDAGPYKDALLQELSALKTALFFKHGSREIAKLETYFDGTFGFKVADRDIVELFGCAYTVFDEIITLQNLYRRVNKGAKLEIGDNGELIAKPHAEMTELMLLYDRRRREFSSTFSPIGLFSGLDVRQTTPSAELRGDRWSTLGFLHNTDRDYEYSVGTVARIKGPGYLPYEISLGCLSFIEPFELQVQSLTGLTLTQLRLAFVALKSYICDRWNEPGVQFTYLNRGLAFTNPSFLLEKLRECIDELVEIEGERRDTEEIVGKFVDLLSTKDRVQQYDPLMRRGTGVLHESLELLTVDLNQTLAILSNLVMDIQLDNESRQIKGSTFERHVADQLLSDCPDLSMPMRPGLRLKRKGERNAFAEVDVYAKVNAVLFLVECKAYSLTREYFRGDYRAVNNRRIVIEGWLDASDQRAKEIAGTAAGSNYSIPDDVSHVVPVICTAFPEFWWNFTDREFLVPKTVPRVCTYHELVQVLQSAKAHSFAKEPFAIPVVRH